MMTVSVQARNAGMCVIPQPGSFSLRFSSTAAAATHAPLDGEGQLRDLFMRQTKPLGKTMLTAPQRANVRMFFQDAMRNEQSGKIPHAAAAINNGLKIYEAQRNVALRQLSETTTQMIAGYNYLNALNKRWDNNPGAITSHRRAEDLAAENRLLQLPAAEPAEGKKALTQAKRMESAAELLFAKHSWNNAIGLFNEVLGLKTSTLGLRHPAVADTLLRVGQCYQYRQPIQYDTAEEYLNRAVKMYKETLPDNSPKTAKALIILGKSLYGRPPAQAKPAEAEAALREAIEIVKHAIPKSTASSFEAMNQLGIFLLFQKRYDEAASLALSALHLANKSGGKDRASLMINALDTLTQAHSGLDNDDKSRHYSETSLGLRVHGKVFGPLFYPGDEKPA